MLETIKTYIKDLPKCTFDEFYQKYIFDIQDNNLSEETQVYDTTFYSINKLLTKIRKEMEA